MLRTAVADVPRRCENKWAHGAGNGHRTAGRPDQAGAHCPWLDSATAGRHMVLAGCPALTRGTIAKIESGVRETITAEEVAALAFVLAISPRDSSTRPVVVRGPSSGARRARAPGNPAAPGGRRCTGCDRPHPPGGHFVASGRTRRVATAQGKYLLVAHRGPRAARSRSHRRCRSRLVWPHGLGGARIRAPAAVAGVARPPVAAEPEAADSRLLIMDYEIAVRSLERMGRGNGTGRGGFAGSPCVPTSRPIGSTTPRRMTSRRGTGSMRFSVIASGTSSCWPGCRFRQPRRRGLLDPFAVAMRAGIPAVLWQPHASPGEMQDFVGALAEGGDMDGLPARIRALTLKGFEGNAGLADITRDLVLLWDDPSRLVPFDESGAL